jgi:hypothetical protein
MRKPSASQVILRHSSRLPNPHASSVDGLVDPPRNLSKSQTGNPRLHPTEQSWKGFSDDQWMIFETFQALEPKAGRCVVEDREIATFEETRVSMSREQERSCEERPVERFVTRKRGLCNVETRSLAGGHGVIRACWVERPSRDVIHRGCCSVSVGNPPYSQ